jgi:hypothetical protein
MATIPERMHGMQALLSRFPDPCGHQNPEWIRAWPFGLVHFSEDWSARLDGRFNTVCGKSPIYWPESIWPEQDVCPDCRTWVMEHDAHAHMPWFTHSIEPESAS